MKKRTIQLLCFALTLVFLALSLTGCNENSPSTDTSESSDTREVSDTADTADTGEDSTEDTTEAETDDGYLYAEHTYSTLTSTDLLKIVGRSTKTDKGITADWSGSGIEFNARCHGDVRITITASIACKFKIFVDDKNPVTLSITGSGSRSYRIASDLEKGEHTFRLLKQSAVESSNNGVLISIDSIEMTGDLLAPPANAPYLVEIIGDSITCGVGSLAKDEPNALGSYAYLFAEQMEVDYSIVSISGIGLIKSTGRHNGLTMLQAYSYLNYYRSKTEKYTPTRQADAVVINLNTNDKGSVSASNEAEYKAAAKQLIREIRAIHGEDVKIIWVYGMMRGYNEGYCDIWANEVLAELGGEAAGYYSRTLPTNTQGVSGHPNTKGHQRAAAVLAEFFNTKNILPKIEEK